MATVSDITGLTRRYRTAQSRRAALIAGLVGLYLRQKVNIDNPDAIDRFLALMVPKILTAHELSAIDGAKYGNSLRKLELPKTNVPFEFTPDISITAEQITKSLRAVGIKPYLDKAYQIRHLDDKQFDPISKQALIREAGESASTRVAGAVARHVQNGGRHVIEDQAPRDPMTIGYVRVTKDNPCYFCAMLASRGLEGGVYGKDSFDLSDPRFVGQGTAKVHDHCACSLKPVYKTSDPILAANQRFEEAWYAMSGEGDADALTNFRRNWEGRDAYLKKAA